MSKIGILYICTGEYTVFWKEFYLSAEQYFLNESDVHYYVFTDAEQVAYSDQNANIHILYQEAMGWPYSTLLRYSMFLQNEDILKSCDFLFFFNANAKFEQAISEKMFLPDMEKGERLVVVKHPAFYDREKYEYPYDRNPRCSAYIPYRKGEIYICGGINGGKTESFLEMSACISERTNNDLKKGIIPLWHDESQINHYILGRNDVKILDAGYCSPEEWEISFPTKILLRNKREYINIAQIRKDTPETKLHFWDQIRNYIERNCVRIIWQWKKRIKD